MKPPKITSLRSPRLQTPTEPKIRIQGVVRTKVKRLETKNRQRETGLREGFS